MLVLNNISFDFGGRYLYRDTSWHIKPREKIGLIGANGTGKSTLLRVLTGEYQLTGGEMTGRKNLSIGFLNQDLLSYETDESILHVALQAFEKQNLLNDQIELLLQKMEFDHSEEIMHKLHDLQIEFEALDGYNIKYKAEAVLEGLGFSTSDLRRPLREFSGGWRMRVMLAKMLLQKPDLLLLDEPTNHLDLPSIQWLEEYLDDYEGTFILVSHDRYFLDRVVNRVVEIDNEKITVYAGNYTFYLDEKKMREEIQRGQFINQQKYIKEQEKLIDRFRYKASKAKFAQSRIKMLERLERVDDVENSGGNIHIHFNFSQQPGKVISKLNINDKSYADIHILRNTSSEILRGDKIALIGANGRGKSTLLRMIYGSEPFVGKKETGYNVIISFYAQHQLEALNLENNPLTELQQTAPDQSDQTLRQLLGAFLFTGDDVFKKIRILSGGEKSRVALSKTVLSKANFMLLDEPTNHLDIQSVNILISVLKNFKGSFAVVSHDRFFLSQIANKIWWIEDMQLKEYPGTYLEFEQWQEERKEEAQSVSNKEKKKAADQREKVKKENDAGAEQKERKKRVQQTSKIVEQLEGQILALNREKNEINIQLSDPVVYGDINSLKALQQKLSEIGGKLAKINGEWEKHYLQLLEWKEDGLR